jgi:ABC-type transport system involved in cytochrome c biogenesis permease subunit
MRVFIIQQIAGLFFFTGLVLAGTDGTLFPWVNALGVFIAFIGALFLFFVERRTATRPGPWRDQ